MQIAQQHKNILTFVCGPSLMVNEVQKAAFKFQFTLHVETFEL